MLYISTFFDAGNVWSQPSQYNPTRLFRGAGIGAAVISPLGPLGIDYAYGFDRVDIFGQPAPGWKLHFKLAISFKLGPTFYIGSSSVMQRLVLVSLAAVAVLVTAPTALLGQGSQAAPAPASPPGPIKIAFISSQEILQKTPGYAAAESTYRKELQASQTEYQKLQQQLDSAVQVFDQQSLVLSPAARSAKQKDLQAMQQRSSSAPPSCRTAAPTGTGTAGTARARINSVIQGIRAELNYSVIFDADAAGGLIAAADPALNITPRVLQRLAQAQ